MLGIMDGATRGCLVGTVVVVGVGLVVFVPMAKGDYVDNDTIARYKSYQAAFLQQNWPEGFRPNMAVTSSCEKRGNVYAQSRFTNLRTGKEVQRLYGLSAMWDNKQYCGNFLNHGVPKMRAVALDKQGVVIAVEKGDKRKFTIPVPEGGMTLVEVPQTGSLNKLPEGAVLMPNDDGSITLPRNVKQP